MMRPGQIRATPAAPREEAEQAASAADVIAKPTRIEPVADRWR
jgi:hypothetical protein